MTPRRKIDWATTLLGSLIVFLLGYGANGLSDLKKDMGELKVNFATLSATVELGMRDQFTGQQGIALNARVKGLEESAKSQEHRLDVVEQFCATLRGTAP